MTSTGLFAIFAVDSNNNGTMSYVLKDHQGSMYATVTGNTVERYSFDAWGRRRNPQTLSYDNVTASFDRGYTLHEHYDDFGLINMNGRVYDPYMSTFLSPDNYIQCPDNSQNFNRYAYCLNNPLRYTDPSGEVFGVDDIIIAAVIGAMVNMAYQGFSGNIKSAGDCFAAIGIGALGGAVGGAAGGAVYSAIPCSGFIGGALSGGASGFSSSFTTTYGNSRYQGNSISSSLDYACEAGLTGLACGAVVGGVAQGINSLNYGGDFWTGNITHDFLVTGSPMFEHPNYRNFSTWDLIEAEETDALLRRISWTYGSDTVEKLGINVTTKAPDGFTIDPHSGIFINKNNDCIFGRVFYNPHPRGVSQMYISPYAATHHDATMFKAIVGHELTHAYHYSLLASGSLKAVDGIYTENAALHYSYIEYYQRGYIDMCNTIQCSFQYPRKYYVPSTYSFSIIDILKQIH